MTDLLVVRLHESLSRENTRDPVRLGLRSELDRIISIADVRAVLAEVRAAVAAMRARMEQEGSRG
jgi:hypothetical protein